MLQLFYLNSLIKQKKPFSNLSDSEELLVNDRRKAVLLYKKIMKTKTFEEALKILKIMISQFPFLRESIKGFLYTMYLLKKTSLFNISIIYYDYMPIFKKTNIYNYAMEKIGKALLLIPQKERSNDYLSICTQVANYPFIDKNLSQKLKGIKNKTILSIINPNISISQPILSLNQITSLFKDTSSPLGIKNKCASYLIKIYKNLQISELVKKYENHLNSN